MAASPPHTCFAASPPYTCFAASPPHTCLGLAPLLGTQVWSAEEITAAANASAKAWLASQHLRGAEMGGAATPLEGIPWLGLGLGYS